MILYLIKSALCLAFILGIYHVILERESMHRFKRFFLLGGLGFSFGVPVIPIIHSAPIANLQNGESYIIEVITSDTGVSTVDSPLDLSFVFVGVYLLIATILLTRFAIQILGLLRRAKRHRNVQFKNATLVLLKAQTVPYTFGKYIFVDNTSYLEGSVESELLTHELTHVRQGHSIDVLVVELFRIVFWFNPILPLLKRAIQTNHEYLADQQVIQTHQHITKYQHLLLSKVSGQASIQLASSFTYLLTKKRLKMMTKTTDKMRARFFFSATIPLMAALVLLFGKTTYAQDSSSPKVVEIQMTNETYFKNAVIAFPQEDGTKIYKPYEALTDAEKGKIPPLPPAAPKAGNDLNPPTAKAPNLQPLPEGTVVEVTKDGHIMVMKDVAPPPPPPPPKDDRPRVIEITK